MRKPLLDNLLSSNSAIHLRPGFPLTGATAKGKTECSPNLRPRTPNRKNYILNSIVLAATPTVQLIVVSRNDD